MRNSYNPKWRIPFTFQYQSAGLVAFVQWEIFLDKYTLLAGIFREFHDAKLFHSRLYCFCIVYIFRNNVTDKSEETVSTFVLKSTEYDLPHAGNLCNLRFISKISPVRYLNTILKMALNKMVSTIALFLFQHPFETTDICCVHSLSIFLRIPILTHVFPCRKT